MNKFDDIVDEVNLALSMSDIEMTNSLNKVKNKLENFDESIKSTGYFDFIYSYTCYHFKGASKEVIQGFSSSIEKNTEIELSRRYLIFSLFDLKEYSKCLREIQIIFTDNHFANSQKWLNLRIKELEICCLIYLNKIKNSDGLAFICNFLNDVLQEESEDINIPDKLYLALTRSNITLSKIDEKKMFSIIAKFKEILRIFNIEEYYKFNED